MKIDALYRGLSLQYSLVTVATRCVFVCVCVCVCEREREREGERGGERGEDEFNVAR